MCEGGGTTVATIGHCSRNRTLAKAHARRPGVGLQPIIHQRISSAGLRASINEQEQGKHGVYVLTGRPILLFNYGITVPSLSDNFGDLGISAV